MYRLYYRYRTIVNTENIGYSCLMETEKQYVNVLFEDKLLAKIDDFRFKFRFASRTEAIRWLLRAALDAKLAPAKGERE